MFELWLLKERKKDKDIKVLYNRVSKFKKFIAYTLLIIAFVIRWSIRAIATPFALIIILILSIGNTLEWAFTGYWDTDSILGILTFIYKGEI